MASIDCLVDTTPMAKEITKVTHSVNGTTAAVVGMKVAVIKAESDAADHICRNVNRGFYSLIHSQISQKIAKLRSEVDSHLMKLQQLRKQLLALKDRMGRDYNMTCARYTKLFNGLNRNLRQRIYELDRPAIDLVDKDADRVSNRLNMLAATVPVSQRESLTVSQKLLLTGIKSQTENTINTVGDFLTASKEQDEILAKLLLNKRMSDNTCDITMPVIIMESVVDSSLSTRTDVYTNPKLANGQLEHDITQAVESGVSAKWQQNTSVNPELRSEMTKLIDSSNMSPRVKDLVRTMLQNSDYQTLTKA